MLGIDVNEVTEIKIEDATFRIGIIPYTKKIELDGAMLKYAGDSKDDVAKKIMENPLAFTKDNIEYVKYGIRGHSGIKDKNGKEILFKGEGDTESGETIVSKETLNLYYHMNLIPRLATAVGKANTLTEAERKNS